MIRRIGYEKSKKWAKRNYQKIGKVVCPALDSEYVVFNNIGFTHLIRKQEIRSRTEQKKRFALIHYTEQIIQKQKASIVYRSEVKKIIVKRYGRKIPQTSTTQYWTFTEIIKKWKIKVVVRQVNKGSKHFYSVMGDEIKKLPKNRK
jgi:sugar-specific transcriptional regulator TrmB